MSASTAIAQQLTARHVASSPHAAILAAELGVALPLLVAGLLSLCEDANGQPILNAQRAVWYDAASGGAVITPAAGGTIRLTLAAGASASMFIRDTGGADLSAPVALASDPDGETVGISVGVAFYGSTGWGEGSVVEVGLLGVLPPDVEAAAGGPDVELLQAGVYQLELGVVRRGFGLRFVNPTAAEVRVVVDAYRVPMTWRLGEEAAAGATAAGGLGETVAPLRALMARRAALTDAAGAAGAATALGQLGAVLRARGEDTVSPGEAAAVAAGGAMEAIQRAGEVDVDRVERGLRKAGRVFGELVEGAAGSQRRPGMRDRKKRAGDAAAAAVDEVSPGVVKSTGADPEKLFQHLLNGTAPAAIGAPEGAKLSTMGALVFMKGRGLGTWSSGAVDGYTGTAGMDERAPGRWV